MGRWGKGQSGNPSGRPKGPDALRALQEVLERTREDGRTELKALLDKIVAQAISGKGLQQRLILERVAPASLALQLDVPKELLVRVIDHTGAGPVVRDEKA